MNFDDDANRLLYSPTVDRWLLRAARAVFLFAAAMITVQVARAGW